MILSKIEINMIKSLTNMFRLFIFSVYKLFINMFNDILTAFKKYAIIFI